MKSLGVDFGLKHIGIAISDADGTVASPLTEIKHRNLKSTVQNIIEISCKQQVQIIVIGLPQTDSEVASRIRSLVNKLRHHNEIPVETVSEDISTREAQSVITLTGTPQNKEHAISAAIILQRYLNRNR